MGDLAVLPKHWWEGTDATGKKRDITQPTLEPPLGSAAYRIESFKPGSEIVWERVPDYWGGQTAGEGRPREFRHAPLHLFPGRQRRLAGLHQGRLRGHPPRKQLAALGDRLQFSGVQGRRRDQGGVRRRHRGEPMQGFVLNHAPAAVPGPPGARGADLCLRLREHEPDAVLRLLHAHRQLFRGQRTRLQRPAAAARNWRSSSNTATSCRRNSSRRNSSCRSTTRRRPTRKNLRKAIELFAAGRLGQQGRQDGQRRRPANRSRSSSLATTRPTSASPSPSSTICASSASTRRCASSIQTQYVNRVQQFRLRRRHDGRSTQSQSPGNEQRDFWSSQGRRLRPVRAT